MFVLWCGMALPCSAAPEPTPPPGSVDSSKIRLDAGDAAGALADAELVIAQGGGADAFAARADAKRAAGRPYEEVLVDYARASTLDPRYIEKYKGFIAQRESEVHPPKKKIAVGINGVPMRFIVGVGVLGVLSLIVAAIQTLRRRGKQGEPADEHIKPDSTAPPLVAAATPAKTTGPPAKKPVKS